MRPVLVRDLPIHFPFGLNCGCQFSRKPRRAKHDSGVERVRILNRCGDHRSQRLPQRHATILSTASVTVDHLQMALQVAF